MSANRTNRNDPCPCGSGRKYKHCHGRVESDLAHESAPAASEDAATLFKRALAAYQQQDLVKAAVAFRRVLEVDSGNALAWHLAGTIDLEHGNYEPASLKLARAVELDPARAEFHRTLARARYAGGALADATVSARR